ncbi:hypothetical protein FFLO_04864 [Filobasidium floriforme]|uniref:Major facilitator superfamily (MFS) profile domain-containing protein n=1 Tax=Filobasidium floriforme TaxID=5210 RepID=A0A8K0JK57_9TREE|nr:hypothetical protein FFLO_04864 [Filobasidium floriforme]
MTSMDNKDDKYTTEHIELDQQGGNTHKHDTLHVNFSKDDVQGDYGQTITALKYKMATAICFAMTVAAAADGYQIGIVGNIIANEGFVRQFGTQRNAQGEPILAAAVLSGWNSIQSVGQIIGMTTTPFFAERFGRKPTLFYFLGLLAISILVESVANKWQVWLVAKLFTGAGVGSLQFMTPTYVTEIAPVKIRGSLLMTYNFWFGFGQFAATLALQRMNATDPTNFRLPIYTQWSQIGIMFIIYLFVPESPVWAVKRGNETLARKCLRRINRGVINFDETRAYLAFQVNLAHEKAEAERVGRVRWYAIFQGRNGWRTLVSAWPLISQQFLGLSLFYSYVSYFFSIVGFADPFRVTCITSGIGMACGVAAAFLAERVGRRYLHNIGATCMLTCCIVVGIISVVPQNGASNTLLVAFTCLWVPGSTLQAATAWVYCGEISSARLRPYTAGFAAATSCVIGIVVGVLVPYMLNETEWNLGTKTAWFYAGLGAPCVVLAWFIMPETAGRTPAELDELFERRIKAWRFAKTQTAVQRAIAAGGQPDALREESG